MQRGLMLNPGARAGETHIVNKLAVDHLATWYRCTPARADGPFLTGKLVHRHHTPNAAALQQLVHEATSAMRLTHPNLVRTIAVHEHGGQAYVVQEHFDGPRLSDLVTQAWRHGNNALGPLCSVFAGIAQGLHHAHRQSGFVHGDVTLENMLLFSDGVGKLLDVDMAGVKVRMGSDARPGRIEYTPPEALRAAELDHRADVYMLAVALYRATTGVFPFGGDSPEAMLEARRHDRPRIPSSIVPDYPPRLEQVVLWALERDPQSRPRSAQELADALITFCRSARGTGRESVRSWLGGLYPPGTDAWSAADPTTTRTPLPQRISSPGSERMTRALVPLLGVVSLAIVAGLGALVVSVQDAPVEHRTVGVQPLLDRAETQLFNNQLAAALRTLEEAEATQPTVPAHVERLQQLLEKTRVKMRTLEAVTLLEQGNPEGALELLEPWLERSRPGSDIHQAYLRARDATQPPPVEPAVEQEQEQEPVEPTAVAGASKSAERVPTEDSQVLDLQPR